jgi:hypothetical protein
MTRKDIDLSHLGTEDKAAYNANTPVERMKSIPRYSPTDDVTKYAPAPKGKTMLPNVKLVHYAQIAAGLALVIIAWVMDQNAHGTLVLPAAVVSALAILKTVLGLLGPSVSPATNLKAVESHRVAVAEASVQP